MPLPTGNDVRPSSPRIRPQSVSAISVRSQRTLPRDWLTITVSMVASEPDQLALEDLAGRVARKLVKEHHFARSLVAGEVVAHVLHDLFLRQLGSLTPDHKDLQPLAELLVRDTYSRDLDDL